jgi:hypothetical protein
MKRVALAFGILVAACDSPDSLLGGRDPGSENNTAAALQCTVKPAGRSYASFDGTKLEDKRANENSSANLARFKPYDVLSSEYHRVLGVDPASLATSSSSFDAPPDRWFAEPAPSGVSLNAMFDLTFQACSASVKSTAMPTADSARDYCTATMRKAWSRSPSPDEVGACTDLATQKLGAETDPRRRWAYVCASILSSSNFLTY